MHASIWWQQLLLLLRRGASWPSGIGMQHLRSSIWLSGKTCLLCPAHSHSMSQNFEICIFIALVVGASSMTLSDPGQETVHQHTCTNHQHGAFCSLLEDSLLKGFRWLVALQQAT